ncbi:hypothetical protein [Lacunimicrobium album]
MTNNLPLNTPQQTARLIAIICMAMISGLGIFAGMAFVLAWGKPPQESMVLSILSVVMMAGTAVASNVVPSIILQQTLEKIKANPTGESLDQRLLPLYMTTTIIRLAMIEAPGFVSLVAFITEHHVWVFAVALASILLILIQLPTTSRIEDWLKYQKETLS